MKELTYQQMKLPVRIYGVSAEKRDQIDKKIFFEIINVLDQMIKSTSILLRNFFLKKISIWSLFPALTPDVLDTSGWSIPLLEVLHRQFSGCHLFWLWVRIFRLGLVVSGSLLMYGNRIVTFTGYIFVYY